MSFHDSPTAEKRRRALPYSPDSEIVRQEHVSLVTGLSAVTIWRLRKAGGFVPTIKLGPNSVGFRRRDIHDWLKQREQNAV